MGRGAVSRSAMTGQPGAGRSASRRLLRERQGPCGRWRPWVRGRPFLRRKPETEAEGRRVEPARRRPMSGLEAASDALRRGVPRSSREGLSGRPSDTPAPATPVTVSGEGSGKRRIDWLGSTSGRPGVRAPMRLRGDGFAMAAGGDTGPGSEGTARPGLGPGSGTRSRPRSRCGAPASTEAGASGGVGVVSRMVRAARGHVWMGSPIPLTPLILPKRIPIRNNML